MLLVALCLAGFKSSLFLIGRIRQFNLCLDQCVVSPLLCSTKHWYSIVKKTKT